MTVERPKDLQRLVGTAWYRTKVQKANRLPSALVSVLRRYILRRESSWKIFEQKRSAVTLVGEANQFWKIVAEFSFEILDQVAHYDGGMLAFSDTLHPKGELQSVNLAVRELHSADCGCGYPVGYRPVNISPKKSISPCTFLRVLL